MVYKMANMINLIGYGADKAAVDTIIMQTSSLKLQQRAIQENANYEDLVNLGSARSRPRRRPQFS